MKKGHQRTPQPFRHAAAPQSHSSAPDNADRSLQSGPADQASARRSVSQPPTANLLALRGVLGNQAVIQQLRSLDRGTAGGAGAAHERIASGPGLLQRALYEFEIVPAPAAAKAPAQKSRASKGSTSAAAPEANADDAYLKWLNDCHNAAKAVGDTYTAGKGKGAKYTTTYQGVSVTVRLDKEKGKFYPRVSFGAGKDLKTDELHGLMDTMKSKSAFIAGVKGEKRTKTSPSYKSGLGVRAVLLASDHIDHPGNLYVTKRFLAKVSAANYPQLYKRGDGETSYGALPSQNTNTVRESSQDRIAAYKAVSDLIKAGRIQISDANTNIPKLRKILAMATYDPDLFTRITLDGKAIDVEKFKAELASKLIEVRWHQRQQKARKDSTVNEFSDVEESEDAAQSEYEKYSVLDGDKISAEKLRLEEMQRQLAIKIQAFNRLEKEKAALAEPAGSSGSEEVAEKHKASTKKSRAAKKGVLAEPAGSSGSEEVAEKHKALKEKSRVAKKEVKAKEKEVNQTKSELRKRKRESSSNADESADIPGSRSTAPRKKPRRPKSDRATQAKQKTVEKSGKQEEAASITIYQSKPKPKPKPKSNKRARSGSDSTNSDEPIKKAKKGARAASSRPKKKEPEPKKNPDKSPQKRRDSRKRSNKKEEDS